MLGTLKKNRFLSFLFFTALILSGLFLFFSKIYNTKAVLRQDTLSFQKEKVEENTKEIRLIAVGDIMMHSQQILSGYQTKTDNYDFSHFFTKIKASLDGDIVYGNLETPIAGKNLKYTGYPTFNAPIELLHAIKDVGFTHLLLANNHALDRGWAGLVETIKNVTNNGFTPIGARLDSTRPKSQITEIHGVRIGFLGYTYGTNGFLLPKDKSYLLSYIDETEIKLDITDIKAKSDLSVITFHFGDEYKRFPNDYQKKISQLACDSGADIILGTHPHVLEPITWLKRSNTDKKCLIAYSLGNFVSAMDVLYTDLGGILIIDIKKNDTEFLITPHFIPTWVKYRDILGKNIFEIRLLSEPGTDISEKEKKRIEIYRKFVNSEIINY